MSELPKEIEEERSEKYKEMHKGIGDYNQHVMDIMIVIVSGVKNTFL